MQVPVNDELRVLAVQSRPRRRDRCGGQRVGGGRRRARMTSVDERSFARPWPIETVDAGRVHLRRH